MRCVRSPLGNIAGGENSLCFWRTLPGGGEVPPDKPYSCRVITSLCFLSAASVPGAICQSWVLLSASQGGAWGAEERHLAQGLFGCAA